MKKFEYKERSAASVMQRSQGGNDFDSWLKRGVQTFKPKAGKHKIRILPATWDNANHYGLDVWLNYSVGPDKGTYLSLNKMKQARDPIYEEYVKAKNEGREDDAKALAARKRILVYVVDRKAEDQGPLLWAMPITFDRDLCLLSCDPDTKEVLSIDHPEHGYDITFVRDGDGQFTKYTGIQISRSTSALHDDEAIAEKWIDFVLENQVPDQLNFYPYEHIKRAFTGMVEDASTKVVAVNGNQVVVEDEEESPFVEDEKPVVKTSLQDRLNARRAR